MMKKIFLSGLVLVFFLLNSCSRLDIAVQFASTYVVSKADDYFDLTSEQRKQLKENFNKDFRKVQQRIFPQVADELMKGADIIETKRPVDMASITISYERMKNLFYDGLSLFSASALILGDQLAPKQIVYFQKEFDKKMLDLKDDENVKTSIKKMKKQFDSWMGTMTSAQKIEMEKFGAANPPDATEKIFNRQLLAHEFVSAYPDKISRKKFIEKITKNFGATYETKFSKSAKERNTKILGMVTSILNKMTADQRQTLVETLRDRANQLAKISKN
ncbi:MAG: hypothetical protein H7336_07940 [Bacteriovorax sp.]|nr:hypothetical protein [Bacteriovorax sp.]